MANNHSDTERRLWEAADEFRANSDLKSSEYATPVLGLIFLRDADHRFAVAEKKLEGKGSGRRKIGKEDYQAKGVMYVPPEARFSHLLSLREGENIGKAINVFQEEAITLTEATRRLPHVNSGNPISIPTIYRWVGRGVLAPDGCRVTLDMVKIGGRACTSVEALTRFFCRLQNPPERLSSSPIFSEARLNSGRERRARQAERELSMVLDAGHSRICKSSSASENALSDILEFLHQRMPDQIDIDTKAYYAVRNGIFAEAVKILDGKTVGRRGKKAAREWLEQLDLRALDVTTLPGVGPHYGRAWTALKETNIFARLFPPGSLPTPIAKFNPPP
jgi:hypothetical protein